MKSIYSIKRTDLENYFIGLGEKNLEQLKYLNGYTEKK